MNHEDQDERVSRLLKELAQEQDNRLPPRKMGEFERNALLKEVERTLAKPEPGPSRGEVWRARFRPALAFGAAAVIILAAVLIAIGPWKKSSDPALLALQWPGEEPFKVAGSPIWGNPQPRLPKTLPNFDSGPVTLGASPNDPRTLWRLATVIIRSEEGYGCGALISADGWIVSNYHVIADAAQKAAVLGNPATVELITAQVTNGVVKRREPPLRATVYRADPQHDLALLKLDALPQGIARLPYYPLADQVRVGEECFVVGSQQNGPAWGLRTGIIDGEFDFPQDPNQQAAGVAREKIEVERIRTRVIESSVPISPGDSGGPLLNAKGELMGLTFDTPANTNSGAKGWHIHLTELRRVTAELPDRSEGVPFDPWTAGLPQSVLLAPQLADGDGDGRMESLRYRYAGQSAGDPPSSASQALALAVFVDFSQRTMLGSSNAMDLLPGGLWGAEDRGRFKCDLFITVRSDGFTAIGTANREGIVDEIRIGRPRENVALAVWRRDRAGRWHSSKPVPPLALLDPQWIGGQNFKSLGAILKL